MTVLVLVLAGAVLLGWGWAWVDVMLGSRAGWAVAAVLVVGCLIAARST